MDELGDESVHMCVTSPPYWVLRRYAGVPDLVFDGKKDCQHKDAKVIPATVLDCFCGTGTTLAVAKRLGRQSIGYELSEDYCKLTVKRIEKETAPLKGL